MIAPSIPYEHRGGLRSRGFLGLLATQLLGATNDNVLRWLVVPIGKELAGPGQEAMALSAGLACFVLPYLLLAGPAGYLADRFSKRNVIVTMKAAEVAIMLLGVAAILAGNIYVLFSAVALMGAHSALYAPAKFGCIPELVRPDRISAANGAMGVTTVAAIVLGTVAGNYLYDFTRPLGQHQWWYSAATLLALAALGCAASLLIPPLKAADPTRRFSPNIAGQVLGELKHLMHNRSLARVAVGIAFFWLLASLFQLNVDVYGTTTLGLPQREVGPLLGVLALGVGLGSVAAGLLSAGRVELGLVPLAATGVAASSMLLFTSGGSVAWTCTWLCTLGFSAGLFDVPMNSYLQHRSPSATRGSLLAATNFLTFSAMLLSAGLFSLVRMPLLPGGQPLLDARGVFLVAGVLTLPVALYALLLLPQATIRLVVWLASKTIYRVRVLGRENLPNEGGALLVANHLTWIDGVLLLLTSSRPIRMVVSAQYVRGWWVAWLARLMGAIPIEPGRKSVATALRSAKAALEAGELVCIFPEGRLSRTGQLLAFQPGFLSIVKSSGAPVLPVYLDGLWGSIFSFAEGKFFWKWPRRWPYPVWIHFGHPIAQPQSAHHVRSAVQSLGAKALGHRNMKGMILPRAMLRQCRRSLRTEKVTDTTGMSMTGGTLLMRMLIFRRLLLRNVLGADEKFVGLLVPPSAGAVLANAALTLCGRVPVNLNYTCSSAIINACIKQCGIKHVLTSRKVMQKLELKIDAELVYLEDFKDQVTLADKLAGLAGTYATPMWMLERQLGLHRLKQDDLVTVIFTSGSTGEPKGVMLSYENVGHNIEAIDQLVQLTERDVVAGILPFFHSFGYTTTLWTVLTMPPRGVYHVSPLDARIVCDMCSKQGATILIATPTFLRNYLRRCEGDDLKTLEVVIAGAEKLPGDLCDAFEQKFGVRPVEGYGATELSPLVSVNIPPSRSPDRTNKGIKEGTVGRPVPGVAVKIIHPETGKELGANEPGMLWVKGPNVMQGYLHMPDKTAEVVVDGWYKTGDIALVDDDGFIKITGRESRFSKIGGEMVPHVLLEEHLQQIVRSGDDELKVVVCAVPDARKGERLVVLHTHLDKTPEQICHELRDLGLPALWIPGADSFSLVESIPVLGTGKLDLKAVKEMALERFAARSAAS